MRYPGPLMASALRQLVGEVEDARGEGPRVHQLQLRLILSFLKKALPASHQYRMDHQLQLVEQAVVQERADQRAAAGDHDVPALPLLEVRYLVCDVLAD